MGAHANEPFAFSEPTHECSDHLASPSPSAHEVLDVQLATNNFSVIRNLVSYRAAFSESFGTAVERLRFGETWIDMGAGLAIAQTQYLQEHRLRPHLPNLVALAYERPRRMNSSAKYRSMSRARNYVRRVYYLEKALEEFEDNFVYLEGKKIEDMKVSEIALPGSVKLITDLFGPISYSPEFIKILRTYGELLAFNGQLHILVSEENFKIFESSTGHELSLFDFVEKYCEGLRVVRGRQNPVIVRTGKPLKIPQLQTVSFESGSPSLLVFKR